MVDKAAETVATALPNGVSLRQDGVYLDVSLPPSQLTAAVSQIFATGLYMQGIDYPVFLRALAPEVEPNAAPNDAPNAQANQAERE